MVVIVIQTRIYCIYHACNVIRSILHRKNRPVEYYLCFILRAIISYCLNDRCELFRWDNDKAYKYNYLMLDGADLALFFFVQI